MTDAEYARKLDQLDRLLNDPDVPMEPAKVWSLLAELAQRDIGSTAHFPEPGLRSVPHGGDQEFAVAFRAGDRAFGEPKDAPAWQGGPPQAHTLAHGSVYRGIAHHPLPVDGIGSCLELRLDQRHRPSPGHAKLKRRRQQGGEADEAGVADQGRDRINDDVAGQSSGRWFFRAPRRAGPCGASRRAGHARRRRRAPSAHPGPAGRR